eukprot:1160947-Pelagomonas_calceolata.AAC.6
MAGLVSQCFFGKMPSLSSAEGSIWWSLNPKGPLPHGNMVAIAPITERELSSWLDDTVVVSKKAMWFDTYFQEQGVEEEADAITHAWVSIPASSNA